MRIACALPSVRPRGRDRKPPRCYAPTATRLNHRPRAKYRSSIRLCQINFAGSEIISLEIVFILEKTQENQFLSVFSDEFIAIEKKGQIYFLLVSAHGRFLPVTTSPFKVFG